MPKLTTGLAHHIKQNKPPKQKNMANKEWNAFRNKLKKQYSPQIVKAMIEDLNTRDKQTITDALLALTNTDEGKAARKARKPKKLTAKVTAK